MSKKRGLTPNHKTTIKPGTTIQGCTFVGIEYASVERTCKAVEALAIAMGKNADALRIAASCLGRVVPDFAAMIHIGDDCAQGAVSEKDFE